MRWELYRDESMKCLHWDVNYTELRAMIKEMCDDKCDGTSGVKKNK